MALFPFFYGAISTGCAFGIQPEGFLQTAFKEESREDEDEEEDDEEEEDEEVEEGEEKEKGSSTPVSKAEARSSLIRTVMTLSAVEQRRAMS